MKNEKRYTLEAVQAYLEKLMQEGAVIDEVNGSLFDHYVVYHPQAVEVLQEVYINPWCSAYARHIYRKALPKDFLVILENEAADAMQAGNEDGARYIMDVHENITSAIQALR